MFSKSKFIIGGLSLLIVASLGCSKSFIQGGSGVGDGSSNLVFNIQPSNIYTNTVRSSLVYSQVSSLDSITTLKITIINKSNNESAYNGQIPISKINDYFISTPIPLPPGTYQLTDFSAGLVSSNVYTMKYASPKKDNTLAALVNKPLSIDFTVQSNKTTHLTPEIVAVSNTKPGDFGFQSYSFDLVKTKEFFVSVQTYDKSKKRYEPGTATLNITYVDSDSATHNVATSVDKAVSKATVGTASSYKLKITKSGFSNWEKTLSSSDLENYKKKPYVIPLTPSN